MMTNKNIIIRDTTEEEHRRAIEAMEPFLEIQDNPKVGPFFYEPNASVLFGVLALLPEGLAKNQDGLVAVRTSLREIWEKGVRKQKEKYDGEGPFKSDFKDTLRGYVAYNPFNNIFELHIGKWLGEYPEALNEIIEEFDLLGCNIKTIIDQTL